MSNNLIPRQMHLEFLDTVRSYELNITKKNLPTSAKDAPPIRLLEIGAGTGIQAQRLSGMGYEVTALDVQTSSYRDIRCFDIVEYDGINIPLPNNSYDVVFSSHVLEHVTHLDEVLKETYRVLACDGVCVHLVPTPSCRAWTLAAHYIWLIRRIIKKLKTAQNTATDNKDIPRTPTSAKAWLWTLFPARHGERGNTVTEIYYYSRAFWHKKFTENNFEIIHMESNKLFYTMANSLGPSVSIKKRQRLARLLGSAGHIYVLKKKNENQ